MAAPAINAVLRITGGLSYGCTNLSLVYPHGGTALGLVHEVRVKRQRQDFEVTAEEFGFERVETIQGGTNVEITFALKTWDPDALAAIFPNTATGTTTQHKVVSEPGDKRAGALGSASALTPLVFTPDGCQHAKSATAPDAPHPFVILRRALPAFREEYEAAMKRTEDLTIAARFVGIRDTSGRLWAWGRRADLSL